MIDLGRAFRLLIGAAEPLPAEIVSVPEVAGRVAASAVAAPVDVPGFPRVMMDGYACRAADIAGATPQTPVALRVTAELGPGHAPAGGPGPGEAWAVATGAVLPAGADVVVPRELAGRQGDRVLIRQGLPPGRHVASPDEDIRRGEVLVAAGERIGPAALAALVAAGMTAVRVVRRPRVLLMSTGDELVPAATATVEEPRRAEEADKWTPATAADRPVDEGEAPATAPAEAPEAPAPRVYNSNAAALAADLREIGIDVVLGGIVPDDPDRLRAAFAAALTSDADVILTTGGVSVGPRDRVPRTWMELRARRLLGRLDLKPGGPFFAARCGDKWILGVSGSPASCLATYQVLVRPFLLRLAGRRHIVRPVVDACLAEPFAKAADRPRLLWARLEGTSQACLARPLAGGSGEGRLTAIARSNGLLWMPAGTPPLPAGARLRALRLDWPEDRADLDALCGGDANGPVRGALAPASDEPGRQPPGQPGQQRPAAEETAGGADGGMAGGQDGGTPGSPDGGTAGGQDGEATVAPMPAVSCITTVRPAGLPPAVAVVGASGSGKTRAVAGLIRRLRARGLQVVAVKHAAHGFALDHPGTDSERLAAAGAAAAWLVGPEEVAARFLAVAEGAGWRRWVEVACRSWRWAAGRDPDLVLVEGFTTSDLPKIVVGRPKEEPVRGEVIARLPEGYDEEALDRLAASLPGALTPRGA